MVYRLYRMSHTLINCTGQNSLVSLYFRLLWYRSILKGSIDQRNANTNEILRQHSAIHSPFDCPRWPPWFPDIFRPCGACVKHGCSVSVSFVRVGSQISSRRWTKKDSNIPSSRRTRSVKRPTPRPTKTIKSPPHSLPPPPPALHW